MKSIKLPDASKVAKIFIVLIFIIASAIRIIFVSQKTIEEYQYDVGAVGINNEKNYENIYKQDRTNIKEYRHLDYIMTLYNTGKLPETNKVQLYHPPLHHIICAGWLKLLDHFSFSAMEKLESLQILTCLYSILALFIVLKICDEFKLTPFYKIIVLLFVGFNPLFIIMSGFLSNDMLVSMLVLLCFYLLLRWQKNPSYKNTIFIGLVFGLGCATKTSMSLMGIIIFSSVVAKWLSNLIISIKNPNYKNLYKTKTFLIQSLIFLIIATPLSLAFPIRNYQKFNQPLIYVVPPKDSLLIKENDIMKRYSPFSKEIFESEIYESNVNVFSYTIKSNLIFSLRNSIRFFTLLKFLTIILYAFSLVASIYLLFRNNNLNVKMLVITCFIWIFSFISFNQKYPASCTMHAKYIYCYIALLPIASAYFMQKKDNYTLSMSIYAITTLFAVFSSIGMYFIIF